MDAAIIRGLMTSVEWINQNVPHGDWLASRLSPLVMLTTVIVTLPKFVGQAIKDPSIMTSVSRIQDALFTGQWSVIGPLADQAYRPGKAPLLKEHVEGNVVVDIGTGTGHNLAYLDPSKIGRLICIEPNVGLHADLVERAKQYGFIEGRNLTLCRYGAEEAERFQQETGLGDSSVDCVVSILALCGIPGYQNVIRALVDKLRSGGKFVFFEHVQSNDVDTRRYQNVLNPVWSFCMGNCQLNRPTDKHILNDYPWTEKQVWGFPGETRHAVTIKAIGWARK